MNDLASTVFSACWELEEVCKQWFCTFHSRYIVKIEPAWFVSMLSFQNADREFIWPKTLGPYAYTLYTFASSIGPGGCSTNTGWPLGCLQNHSWPFGWSFPAWWVITQPRRSESKSRTPDHALLLCGLSAMLVSNPFGPDHGGTPAALPEIRLPRRECDKIAPSRLVGSYASHWTHLGPDGPDQGGTISALRVTFRVVSDNTAPTRSAGH